MAFSSHLVVGSSLVIRYTLTIFLSAFLLFMVQPLAARLILPGFGGTAAVWTTCLMYFQVALLCGYLYAHTIRSFLSPRAGWLLHCLLLFIAMSGFRPDNLSIPILDPESNLSAAMAWRLTISIGFPFLMLSATGPLVQAWQSISGSSQRTYRLYAVSNAGSLMALVAYPFVFDRLLGVSVQKTIWFAGFVVFCLLMTASGLQVVGKSAWQYESNLTDAIASNQEMGGRLFQTTVWVLLPAIASTLLLSSTNILCQEVASYPFLWILPLVSYLLGLIICFDRPAWYRRQIFYPLFAISTGVSIVLFHRGINAGLWAQAIGSATVVFAGSMVCHGELYRLKPATSQLTQFYLAIAFGGAIGGFFAVVIAPEIFNGFFEFHCSLLACLIAAWWMPFFRNSELSNRNPKAGLFYAYGLFAAIAATPVICSLVFLNASQSQLGVVFRERNEFGIVRVQDLNDYRYMYNGQTNHGGQYLNQADMQPSAYYSSGSGAAVAFKTVRNWKLASASNPSLHVGVLGLGTGSLSSYAQTGDEFRFYEINPLVVDAAREFFTYLKQSDPDVVVGDGRVQMLRELDQSGGHDFDLLFVDAFSSDSIPVHLLTSECFDLYLQHLNANGIIVVHITNRFVDLRSVLYSIARSKELGAVLIEHKNAEFGIRTRWVLMSRNNRLASEPIVQRHLADWPTEMPTIIWTDDFSSLASVVIWSARRNSD